MKEVRRKVSEYQRHNQADQIKHFSLMDLKRFQAILSSGENLVEEEEGIISGEKKECHKIWESASALLKEAGMPQIGRWESIPTKSSWIEAMETTHQEKKESLRQVKDLRWENFKSILVDETRLQTKIESWSSGAEVSMRKKIMKGVCQSSLTFGRL